MLAVVLALLAGPRGGGGGGSAAQAPCDDGDVAGHGCRCKCIFVDVGLNDGGTLVKWPHGVARRRNVARSVAAELQSCLDPKHARGTCYIGIEPNPAYYAPRLRELEASLRALGTRAQILTNTSLAVEEGNATLYVAKHDHGIGSTLESHKAYSHTGLAADGARRNLTWHVDRNRSVQQVYRTAVVRTVAAAPFLSRLLASAARVFVKLDIEAFEYELIRATLATQEWTQSGRECHTASTQPASQSVPVILLCDTTCPSFHSSRPRSRARSATSLASRSSGTSGGSSAAQECRCMRQRHFVGFSAGPNAACLSSIGNDDYVMIW